MKNIFEIMDNIEYSVKFSKHNDRIVICVG